MASRTWGCEWDDYDERGYWGGGRSWRWRWRWGMVVRRVVWRSLPESGKEQEGGIGEEGRGRVVEC